MDLLIAILFALKVYVDPSMSMEDIKRKNPLELDRAVKIMDNNLYHIGTNGVIIIDETGSNK